VTAGGSSAVALWMAAQAVACGGTLDAGRDVPHGLLPVDERNPVIIDNDASSDNWAGEYTVLFANSGGPPLVGIVVSASKYWPELNTNVTGWTNLVAAARSSGLQRIPDITMSAGGPLARPADGQIDSTAPNRAAGARLIVDLSRQLSLPWRPVVVLAGGPLTNLADAYLVDHTVVDRVVVVASLGSFTAPTGMMTAPNGELDPWADWIVAHRFRYVQVSAFYDQTGDVTAGNLSSLPQNPLGAWMAKKQPDLFTIPTAADQVTVLAVALPTFAIAVQRASPSASAAFDTAQGPPLAPDEGGNVWIVTQIAAPLAASRLWLMLLDPHTYGS